MEGESAEAAIAAMRKTCAVFGNVGLAAFAKAGAQEFLPMWVEWAIWLLNCGFVMRDQGKVALVGRFLKLCSMLSIDSVARRVVVVVTCVGLVEAALNLRSLLDKKDFAAATIVKPFAQVQIKLEAVDRYAEQPGIVVGISKECQAWVAETQNAIAEVASVSLVKKLEAMKLVGKGSSDGGWWRATLAKQSSYKDVVAASQHLVSLDFAKILNKGFRDAEQEPLRQKEEGETKRRRSWSRLCILARFFL